ncbi:MAG: hypothetical protein ABL903_08370 [Methylococcales bacterium]
MIETPMEELSALKLVTQLGEDVLAIEIANKTLEGTSITMKLPGLLRTYEVLAADMAAAIKQLEMLLE